MRLVSEGSIGIRMAQDIEQSRTLTGESKDGRQAYGIEPPTTGLEAGSEVAGAKQRHSENSSHSRQARCPKYPLRVIGNITTDWDIPPMCPIPGVEKKGMDHVQVESTCG